MAEKLVEGCIKKLKQSFVGISYCPPGGCRETCKQAIQSDEFDPEGNRDEMSSPPHSCSIKLFGDAERSFSAATPLGETTNRIV